MEYFFQFLHSRHLRGAHAYDDSVSLWQHVRHSCRYIQSLSNPPEGHKERSFSVQEQQPSRREDHVLSRRFSLLLRAIRTVAHSLFVF